MSNFRLLLVEDDEGDIQVCRDSIAAYKDQTSREINAVECRTIAEAMQKLDNSYDGAVIDLKLAGQGDEGTQVIKKIVGSNFRIPIAVLTGTPAGVDTTFSYLGTYKKGEFSYEALFDKFWEIFDTGLTRIMGGRGRIESIMAQVYKDSLFPYRELWVKHGKRDSSKTEKAMLRYTLNHLMQLLDGDEEKYFPEEVYIHPPLDDVWRTGSILNQNGGESKYVVLSPACDLVVRSGGLCKTDHILLVGIEKESDVYGAALEGYVKVPAIEKRKEEVRNNAFTSYYHWLPKTDFFPGGFLNFRRVTTINIGDCKAAFGRPAVQISPPFVKDIISRFSSYYARQGQPEIDPMTL